MKKLTYLLLAIVIMIMCIGCSQPLSDDDDSEDTSPSEKVELSRGKISGDVYKNKYLGLEFIKPESWVYSTDEEIAAVIDLGAETLLGENFQEALDNNPSIYDMMVVDTITRSSVSVGYENLAQTLSTNITERQYAEAVKSQLSGVTGVSFTFEDYQTVQLGDTEFLCLSGSTVMNGVSMKQIYYMHKTDGYMAFIIVTIPSGYTVSEIEAMFK